MGFLDKIKKAFDKGGVDIDIDAPDSFRWKDDFLPVAVRLTNEEETEERLITSLDFTLREEARMHGGDEDESPSERARRQRRAKENALRHSHTTPITLAPGEVVVVEIEIPLSLGGALEAAGVGDDAPEWLSTASKAMNMFKDVTRDDPWFRLEVRPQVEGFSAAKVASRRIRNLRFGEFSAGWITSFHL